MPALLAPAALWALAVLGLPLAVHLWRRPPRTVQLGSLRFLREHSPRRWRNVRWREQLLMFIRLGLLLALVVLLARPIWRQPPATRPQRWVLLDPAAAVNGSSLTRLRALQTAGYETHWLDRGFPVNAPTSSGESAVPVDLWSLLREADALLPEGSTLAVFTPGRLASLHGIRPGLRSKLEWVETADAVSPLPQAWLQSVHAAPLAGQSPMVVIGRTEADATTFVISPPPGWKMENRPDAARLVDLVGHPQPWVTMDPLTTLKVLILHDPTRAEDARFLAAAVRAATQSAVKLELNVSAINLSAPTLLEADWTFWLSSSTPPASMLDRETHLFLDAPQADDAINGWIVSQIGLTAAGILPTQVRLWRRGTAPAGAVVWTDGHGTPLLTRTETGHGTRWQFASRFHPDWNDLPRTTALPSFLRGLLLPSPKPPGYDLRLSPHQARPAVAGLAAAPARLPGDEAFDLHWPLWMLAAVVFCVERVLSHSRRIIRPVGLPVEPAAVPAR